ncbi:MAG TPA: hypothetical protein PK926_13085 [Spirochaetota bacterium]|nr:hypothetical protein [Spirochaetota bacterium]HPI89569.1 hypothetical protein [Spirochaetota bacterium]HPR49033.1 hypothetical protein [Spirochaetota bacterium]
MKEETRQNIQAWMKTYFKLPAGCTVCIDEKENTATHESCRLDTPEDGLITDITIYLGEKPVLNCSVNKPAANIQEEDIAALRESVKTLAYKTHPFLAKIFHFLGWWAIFAGSLSLFSVCPICGQIGCPVGVGVTGVIAGLLAFLKQYLKDFVLLIKENVRKLINSFQSRFNKIHS